MKMSLEEYQRYLKSLQQPEAHEHKTNRVEIRKPKATRKKALTKKTFKPKNN